MHLVVVEVQPIRSSARFSLVAVAEHIAARRGGATAVLEFVVTVFD